MYEQKLTALLKKSGADIVGFSCVKDVLPEELSDYPYAVTIVRRLSRAVTNTIKGAPTMSYFQHYRITNTKLDLIALDAVSFIEKKGYLALPIAASQSTPDKKEEYKGLFPHKTGAVLSGIGFIGKNSLLITKYGSFVRLATVLTDMPLERSSEPIKKNCGECMLCRDACPAGAITGKEYIQSHGRDEIFDAKKCSEHMKKAYQNIGRGAVCGICMSVCPYNFGKIPPE